MLSFRKATFSDAQLLFDWVNETQVRENSFDTQLISWENHLQWLNSRVKEGSNTVIFIFEENSKPIGQVRFDKKENAIFIDYSIDVNERGKGYGREILHLALSAISEYLPNQKIIFAEVKEENLPSLKVFQKLGFVTHQIITYKQNKVIQFKKEL